MNEPDMEAFIREMRAEVASVRVEFASLVAAVLIKAEGDPERARAALESVRDGSEEDDTVGAAQAAITMGEVRYEEWLK